MTNAAPIQDASPATIPSREAAPRFDMYGPAHKGLRYLLCHLLIEVGRASFAEEREADMVLAALEVALSHCDRHIAHEDGVIRPALEERTPKLLSRLDHEHEQHATQVAELRAMGKALREAEGPEDRAAIGRTLYLHLSVFVAETLAHMAYEERMVQTMLDRHFTFDEQVGIHSAIIRSSPPSETMEFLRAVIPASSREERFVVLKSAPRPVIDELLPLLADADQKDLLARLGQ